MAFTKSFLKPPLTFPAVSGDVCSFVDKLGGFPLKAHEVSLVAKQAAGTPSPSSPLPISGWDAIHIQNTCGINQWDEVWEVGTYDASGQKTADNRMIRSKNYIAIKPNTTYYVQSANVAFVYFFYDIDKNFIGTNYLTNSTFTSPANAYYMNFRASADYGNVYHNDISINYPSTDTSYHAFVGQSITVQIGSTIYGGTYDAITGELTISHVANIYDGSADEAWIEWTVDNVKYYFIENSFDVAQDWSTSASNNKCMCNIYSEADSILNSGFLSDVDDLSFCNQAAPYFKRLWVINRSITSLADFKTALSNQNLVIVYPLAEAQEIQLSPAQILTLKNNNIWADTGATSLQYIKIGR